MMLDSVLMLAGFVSVALAPNVEVFLLGDFMFLNVEDKKNCASRKAPDRSQRRQ